MNQLKRLIKCGFLLTLCVSTLCPLSGWEEKDPLTVAESSHFTATSRYSDVMEFIYTLQEQSALIRVETLCTSTEGQSIPLLIIGNPPPSSPLELYRSKKAAVYIQANIHAGEVEGKEACLMLARNIVHHDTPPYLHNLVVLLAPLFNADGNEKISRQHRRNQAGPEQGVGIRYNGQNLDLNRDSMKLESPELRGLVRNVLMRWDPVLLVDCHTTNGSPHREPVTYSWPLNPNGSVTIIEYMRNRMMPAIQKHLKETSDILAVPYGNFMDFRNPEKGWRTFIHHPRFVTNYTGLRNRLSILNENYAYADYRTRVLGCYHFLHSILNYCDSHKDELVSLVSNADRNTVQKGLNPPTSDTFAVEFGVDPLPNNLTLQGWEMEVIPREEGRPRIRKTDRKKTYTLPYYADFVPKRAVRFPCAYLLPLYDEHIQKKLLQHGVVVEKLLRPTSLEVVTFRIQEIKGNERIYQGHRLNSVKGEYAVETRKFPEGTLYIATSQPLGNLAAYLLEPESDDGLLVWNFFDRYIAPQWGYRHPDYPVFKLMTPVPLVKDIIQYPE